MSKLLNQLMFHSQKRLAQCWWVLKLSYNAEIGYLSGIHLLSVSLHLFSNTVHFLPLDRNIEETGRENVYVPRENREKNKRLIHNYAKLHLRQQVRALLGGWWQNSPLWQLSNEDCSRGHRLPAHKDIWSLPNAVCAIANDW